MKQSLSCGKDTKILYHHDDIAPVDTGFADAQTFSTGFMAELQARTQAAARAPQEKQTYKPGPRPARAVERLMDTIKSVIPEGFRLGLSHWFRCVTRMVRDQAGVWNRNRLAVTLKVARILWNTRDHATATTSPGIEPMAQQLNVSTRTITRHLKTLEAWGVLAVVAEGRSRECSEEKTSGDRKVMALLLSDSEPVEEIVTPIETLSPVNTPQIMNPAQYFARKACGASEYQPLTRDQRNEPLWHGHKTTSSLDEEGVATHELIRRLSIALGKATVSELRPVLSPIFQRGGTIKNIMHMIDYRPDGSSWSHDGATGVRNVAAWLRNRLSAWDAAVLPV